MNWRRLARAAGATGHLLSPHSRDFIGRWRDGEYVSMVKDGAGRLAPYLVSAEPHHPA